MKDAGGSSSQRKLAGLFVFHSVHPIGEDEVNKFSIVYRSSSLLAIHSLCLC